MAEKKEKLKLYSYWKSSCSHRVRIALTLKGIEYEYVPVNPLKRDEFLKINPMGAVPALVDGDVVVSDSLAIIMYLDEKYPELPLLPRDLHKRAVNYQAASIVFSGIQPYQNTPVARYIEEKTNAEEKTAWVNNAITKGFTALEDLLVSCTGKYATGDEVYLHHRSMQLSTDSRLTWNRTQHLQNVTSHTMIFLRFKTQSQRSSLMLLLPQADYVYRSKLLSAQ